MTDSPKSFLVAVIVTTEAMLELLHRCLATFEDEEESVKEEHEQLISDLRDFLTGDFREFINNKLRKA